MVRVGNSGRDLPVSGKHYGKHPCMCGVINSERWANLCGEFLLFSVVVCVYIYICVCSKFISGVESHLLRFEFYEECGISDDVLEFHGDPCVAYMLELLKFLWPSD